MGNFSHPGLFWFLVFGSIFLTAGIVHHAVFWLEIEPVLWRLGYRYDVLSLRKYPDGYFTTLFEYKRFQIAEKKSLKWWWAYWGSFWTLLLVWVGWAVLVFGTSP